MFPDESVLDCIGNTPLLKLKTRFGGQEYQLHAKVEFMNPSGSMKDRIAKHMVEQAEAKGLLKPGFTILKATSGNIALSMVAASKRYKMLVVMPEHMTGERIKIMTNLGAEVCLTPRSDGFEGAVAGEAMFYALRVPLRQVLDRLLLDPHQRVRRPPCGMNAPTRHFDATLLDKHTQRPCSWFVDV